MWEVSLMSTYACLSILWIASKMWKEVKILCCASSKLCNGGARHARLPQKVWMKKCHHKNIFFSYENVIAGVTICDSYVCVCVHARVHNIIHNHNNVMWDRQYYVEYSSHSAWRNEGDDHLEFKRGLTTYITSFISITLLRGIDDILRNIPHIHPGGRTAMQIMEGRSFHTLVPYECPILGSSCYHPQGPRKKGPSGKWAWLRHTSIALSSPSTPKGKKKGPRF